MHYIYEIRDAKVVPLVYLYLNFRVPKIESRHIEKKSKKFQILLASSLKRRAHECSLNGFKIYFIFILNQLVYLSSTKRNP
jgi:hypothetical protein